MAIKKWSQVMRFIRYAFIVLLFISSSAFSGEHAAFEEFDRFNYNKITQENILDLGRTRSQDGLGVCYAFTIAKQLEHICSSSLSCELNGDEVSPLSISRTYEDGSLKKTYPGGSIHGFLKKSGHRSKQGLSLVKESCIPFDQTIHKRYLDKRTYIFDEAQGIKYLKEIFDKVTSPDCVDCKSAYAKEIKTTLVRLKTPIASIESLLTKLPELSFDSFLDELLFDNACNESSNKLSIPPFRYSTITTGNLKNNDGFVKHIKNLIDNNIPPTISLCLNSTDNSGNTVCGSHAVMADGYRQRCNFSNQCRFEIRIKNSWGESWQKNNNDGWISGEALATYTLNEPANDNKLIKRASNLSVLYVLTNTNSKDVKKNPLNIDRPLDNQSITIQRPTAPIPLKTDDQVGEVKKLKPIFDVNKPVVSKKQGWTCFKVGDFIGTDSPSEKDRYLSEGYRCSIIRL
jgi:hypothetical protein